MVDIRKHLELISYVYLFKVIGMAFAFMVMFQVICDVSMSEFLDRRCYFSL